ncbi:hypothetical protein [Haloglycomyces albus]|uniref:hypothetical protein n=1 Tax=Haloglycomyces albus TaxID=526067 RepID=UPI00046D049C|nr:hypothetical protein [Haloglycomyces albus]
MIDSIGEHIDSSMIGKVTVNGMFDVPVVHNDCSRTGQLLYTVHDGDVPSRREIGRYRLTVGNNIELTLVGEWTVLPASIQLSMRGQIMTLIGYCTDT